MAAAQVEGEYLVTLVGWVTTKNWILQRVKGVETVSITPAQYLRDRRRKKKVIQARSVIVLPLGELPCVIESMQWKMETRRVVIFWVENLISCRSQTVVPGEN